MNLFKRIFSIPNLVTVITILLGAAASIGITERFYPTEKILTALVTLVAAQLLVDRLGILSSIYEKIGNKAQDNFIELLPRTDPKFERFSVFAKGAFEIMVIGIDLGFMANADAWFVKQALESGVHLKLLISNPNISGGMKDIINNHDERNSLGKKPVHDHIDSAKITLETLCSLVPSDTKGKLEIRSRIDIPNPTMALVDPTKPHGKIRVELKLYKKNHGDVPYFILTRSSTWYDMFFNHYYVKLWNDSEVLYQSWETDERRQAERILTADQQKFTTSLNTGDSNAHLSSGDTANNLLEDSNKIASRKIIEGQLKQDTASE